MANSAGILFSAGDTQSCFRKLESLLRVIKYPGCVDYNGLHKGDPSAFLPIVSFTLTSFSPAFTEQLMASGLELSGKTDLRFTDTLYKVLRDVFHYKPILNKHQFLQSGFSQRKLSFICDIISLVLQRHRQLIKVNKRPFVADKAGKPSSFVNPPSEEARPSHDAPRTPPVEVDPAGLSADEITVTVEGVENKESLLRASEVERRLSALETQLQTVLSELNKLKILEKRLEKLETLKNTEKEDGLVVTISRDNWENLMSRVFLLETKQELRDTQMEASLTCQSSSSSLSRSSCSDASQVDIKERLERIGSMLKNSSRLLKEPEVISSP